MTRIITSVRIDSIPIITSFSSLYYTISTLDGLSRTDLCNTTIIISYPSAIGSSGNKERSRESSTTKYAIIQKVIFYTSDHLHGNTGSSMFYISINFIVDWGITTSNYSCTVSIETTSKEHSIISGSLSA